MNNLKISLAALLLVAVFHTQAQNTASKNVTPTAQTAKPAVSENMKTFLAMFNGTSKAVGEALTKYEQEGLDRKDMSMYNLLEPVVVSSEIKDKQETYHIEVKSGVTTRKYTIVWTDSKISEIKDLGLKL